MTAEQRQTRGRPSKIDLLPDGVRDQLHQMLREKRHTQHNDEQDSDIPPKAARNAAPRVFSECFCHAFSGSLRVTIQSVPRA